MKADREISDEEIKRIYEEANGSKKRTVDRLSERMSKSNAYRRVRLVEQAMNAFDSEGAYSLNGKDYIPSLDDFNGFLLRGWFDQLFDAYLLEETCSCLLMGAAGCGKTESVRHLAAIEELPFLIISFDAMTGMSDLFGQVELTDGNTHFAPSTLLMLMQHPSIILFDEINAASAGNLFKLHELLASRTVYIPQMKNRQGHGVQGQVIQVHPECRFFLACNPTGGRYYGTQRLNAALLNRCVIIRVPPFTTKELDKTLHLKVEIKRPLLRLYDELSEVAKKQGLSYEISLRNLKYFCALYSKGTSLRSALEMAILNHICATGGEASANAALALAKSIFGRRLEDG